MTVDEWITLTGARKSGAGMMAKCAAHDDRVDSLSIAEGEDGRTLLNCFAGCTLDEITAAYGKTPADLFPDKAARDYITVEYQIKQAVTSAVVAYHVRREGPDGKNFYWKGPDGRTGLNGTPVADLPLYGVERLTDADRRVVVVEGEKAADALRGRGIPTVGTVTGAAATPAVTVLEALRDRDAVLWADNDEPGRAHMARIASHLATVAASIGMATWTDAPKGGDAADYSGNPWDIILAAQPYLIAARIAPTMAAFISETDVEDALIPGLIPTGGLVVFVGEPRSFKTMSALNLGFTVAYGTEWLGKLPETTGDVLYIGEEGSRAALRDRLTAMARALGITLGGNDRIRILHRAGIRLGDAASWRIVEDTLKAMRDPKLVIIDTLARTMTGDENSAQDMNAALRPLQQIIADFGVTVVVVHHSNKYGEGRAGKRMRGSSALWGAADNILAFKRDEAKGVPVPAGVIETDPKDTESERIRFDYEPVSMQLVTGTGLRLTPDALADHVRALSVEGAPVSLDEIRKGLPYGESWLFERIAEAVKAGKLVHEGRGWYGVSGGVAPE
jgi:hypothetical protein